MFSSVLVEVRKGKHSEWPYLTEGHSRFHEKIQRRIEKTCHREGLK
jgi:hypothetical protein